MKIKTRFASAYKTRGETMTLSTEEIDILFESDKLLFTQSPEAVISCPSKPGLSPSQSDLIKKILKSMGFTPTDYVWNFYGSIPERKQIEEICEALKPKLVLALLPLSDLTKEPIAEKVGEIEVLSIPHPFYMEEEESVKRLVWKLLKQFSKV